MYMKSEINLRESIERNTFRANLSAWLIVAGVVVEIVQAVFARQIGNTLPDAMIALGIAGEILFDRNAARAAGTLQQQSDERIAELNAAVEQERLARVMIEKRLLDRRLYGDRCDRVTSALKEYARLPGDIPIPQVADILRFGMSYETTVLVEDIVTAITAADWCLTHEGRFPGLSVRGVDIMPTVDARSNEVAAMMVRVLTEAGIFCELSERRLAIGQPVPGIMTKRAPGNPQQAWDSRVTILVGDHPWR